MTSATEFTRRRAAPALGTFERYLTLWVALCILAGIVLGRLVPGPFRALGRLTVAEVNIPVAVLIWLMMASHFGAEYEAYRARHHASFRGYIRDQVGGSSRVRMRGSMDWSVTVVVETPS